MLYRSNTYRAVLISTLLSAVSAFAQAPPAYVDQALRARVDEFFQCHVDGNFRKAYEFVAEDTKDFYFAALKVRLKSFKVTGVKYSNDFTRATVDLNTDQEIRRPEFPGTVVPIPMTTTWKIEEGKWVWSRDAADNQITPMGHSDVSKIMPGDKISPQDLPKVVTPEELQRMAVSILHQAGIDKQEVTLATDKPSSAEVRFHNGQPGTVKLVLDAGAKIPGFSATLDKLDVAPKEDAVLKLTYNPPAESGPMPPQVNVRLIVQPFSQVFGVAVKFTAPAAAKH